LITAITGAEGYVGRAVARRVLESSDDEVLALVHARNSEELGVKRASLERELGPNAARLRCRPLHLPDWDGSEDLDTAGIRYIVHSAAVTAFNVERARAEAVNVQGTAAVLRFARRCTALERFALVSTIYSTGLRGGPIDERAYGGECGFANHYEWSKWSAEALLESELGDLPWQVHRLATVLCDDGEGRVVQFNVVHKMWKLLYSGLLPLLPGAPETRLYFVTGQHAARSLVALMRGGPSKSFFHLSNSIDDAPSVRELLGLAFEAFTRDRDFARRRVLRPLFADEASFERLADTAAKFSRDALGTVIALMRPFAKQLFVQKAFSTELASALVPAFRPSWAELVPSTCAELIASRWGLG
jgi:nucleoside-diphosphate-sugar epimerase